MTDPSSSDKCMRGQDPTINKDGTIRVPLTRGQYTVVDPEVYEIIRDRLWHAAYNPTMNAFYAMTYDRETGGFTMHQFIMGTIGKGHSITVDHIDLDTLRNTTDNLRLASSMQNSCNKPKQKTRSGEPMTSKYKGVFRQQGRWRACLRKDGKLTNLGYFDIEKDAAIAYDIDAREEFGEFARTNFSEQPDSPPEKRVRKKLSRFRGVVFVKATGKWGGQLCGCGKSLWLGTFQTEVEAARAYDSAARSHFGKHAFTNEDAGLYNDYVTESLEMIEDAS